MIFHVLCTYSQIPWIEESYRSSHFSPDLYYVSYHHLINENNNLDECVARTISETRSMLANNISTNVTSVSRSSVLAKNQNGNLTENESFFYEFTCDASAHLVNVTVDHFYDSSTNTVHAIAYVKKLDLTRYCEDKIKADLASLNDKIQSIENFIESGHKSEAKMIVEEALLTLNKYPSYVSQLIAIGESNMDLSNVSTKFEQISRNLIRFKSDLEHCVSIYLIANNSSPIIKSDLLANKCRGLLSEKGCHFVNSAEDADYSIIITYSTRTSSNTDDMWFAYSDVNLTVTRKRDGIVMYDDVLSIKGGASTEEKAHRKAIDQSPKPMCEKILTYIQ